MIYARLVGAPYPLLPGTGTSPEGFWGKSECVRALIGAHDNEVYYWFKAADWSKCKVLLAKEEHLEIFPSPPKGREKESHDPRWDDGEVYARPVGGFVELPATKFYDMMIGRQFKDDIGHPELAKTPEEIYESEGGE